MFQNQVVEKIKTHILCSTAFVSLKIVLFEIMWKKYCRAGQAKQMTIWRRRFACWITKATSTQYVILIAFPLQQWLRERCAMFRTLPALLRHAIDQGCCSILLVLEVRACGVTLTSRQGILRSFAPRMPLPSGFLNVGCS
jgi:hypothetical protein